MEIKPLTPQEVKVLPIAHPQMIEVVNELLRLRFDGARAVIKQDEIKEAFLKRVPEYDSLRMFAEKLMDFEPTFRNAGWHVVYEKPGYNESGFAFFTFSPRNVE
jgi:hypothetical protein